MLTTCHQRDRVHCSRCAPSAQLPPGIQRAQGTPHTRGHWPKPPHRWCTLEVVCVPAAPRALLDDTHMGQRTLTRPPPGTHHVYRSPARDITFSLVPTTQGGVVQGELRT